ncbi:UDP-glucose 4-epimerase [Desulfosporosinus acididurans]|uniref:UDP-glucose 4-epimerase n=1 Tax=Desulfosporosinus acididurans TaxID=476652 RepID=A0A0J1IMF0_9FIRM|nr:NAD-dependent epimerase/dehydratase family protein [Desulfosporosinus acididurans]KLU65871.1 UDP-glucose 4-epimerase [Desulfosporosinus acididurans]
MKALVTGGAGFIGSWVVAQLLQDGHEVWTLDNLSNGSEENLKSYVKSSGFKGFIRGDIKDNRILEELFANDFAVCYHLAASINVQDSIDDPQTTFENDVIGTFNVLEYCRNHGVKMVFMSTCMVYDKATGTKGIDENSPIKPASPYAGSKIAGENMVLSYFYAYGLPTVVIRPFNTYGPRQKASGEGGVVSIFTSKALKDETLNIYGSGEQTRDLLYVEDCARFVVAAGLSDSVNGQIINAGLGKDISINGLAYKICGDARQINHIAHIHPQSEIQKLLCNANKAKELLNWEPKVSLEDGLLRIRTWMSEQPDVIST